ERRGSRGAVRADRRGPRAPELAPAGPDDDAAVVGRPRSLARLFSETAGIGGAARTGAAFDGNVARSGVRDPGRLDLRARGNGVIREEEDGVSGGMTVGRYSPMPPARTGVADYAASLLAGLREHGNVEANPRRCDAALYQIGNNALHAGIYARALERPGVIVLHDAVLHHFLLGQLDEPRYVEEFVFNYGEWNRGLARELWRGRAASGAD